jgi:hypothetical protein
MAPATGAHKFPNGIGISGECLRTGKIQHCADTENDPLVDVEVCRGLGLRSIAVLPIQGRGGIKELLRRMGKSSEAMPLFFVARFSCPSTASTKVWVASLTRSMRLSHTTQRRVSSTENSR